jgi:beta-mannosidase
MAALEIENPVLGMNLEKSAWVAGSGWVYEKVFVSEDFSTFDRVVLGFEGLDVQAAVSLNDVEVGRGAGAFDVSEFDVKPLIKVGKNKLAVAFTPVDGAEALIASGELRRPAAAALGMGQPKSPSVEIWRGVSVQAYSCVRVREVQVRQDHSAAGVVGLDVMMDVERYCPEQPIQVLVRVCYKGNILHEARDMLDKDVATLRLSVKNPQLWWPVGMGEQPLYEMTVDVLVGRTSHEHVSRRIGLREFRMEETAGKGGTRRRFFINGQPMFLKGASWKPADLYVARLTRVEYAKLVKAAAVANMNCLRVWGGGVYESESFYDLCDEYGLCVWQDMMLCEAQAEKPGAAALAAFEREAACIIHRVRNHPCMVIWCGGDAGGRGVHPAYEAAAARVVREHDSGRPFLPAMAHDPFSLGGGEGLQSLPSYPEPRIVAGYLQDESFHNLSHPVCALHTTPQDGAGRVYRAFCEDFLLPSGFDNALWLSQIQQGIAVKNRFAQMRTGDAEDNGFIFWHYNDCWPTGSASSVDFEGRWKALHFMARRFFAPLTVFGRLQDQTVEVFALNDSAKPFKGEVQWRMTLMEGTSVFEGTKKVSLGPASREKPTSVKVGEALRKFGAANLLLWISLVDEQGNPVDGDVVPFCAWRELNSQPPRIRAEIRTWDDSSFAVILTSRCPALWVWISLDGMDARYDDNFFCLEPERSVRVRITPSTRMKLDQFRQRIRIGSLRDTWQDKRAMMQRMMAAAEKK